MQTPKIIEQELKAKKRILHCHCLYILPKKIAQTLLPFKVLMARPVWSVSILFLLLLLKDYCMTEYLRMSGIYWGLTAMSLMNKLDLMDKDEVIKFIKSCQHENGGFSASIDHDPHLLYTLSAVQVCSHVSEIFGLYDHLVKILLKSC